MAASSTARRSGRGMTTGTGSGKYTVIAAKGPGPACGPICVRSVGSISITWPSMWPPTRRCSTPSGSLPLWCNACVVLFLLCTLAAHEPRFLAPPRLLPIFPRPEVVDLDLLLRAAEFTGIGQEALHQLRPLSVLNRRGAIV